MTEDNKPGRPTELSGRNQLRNLQNGRDIKIIIKQGCELSPAVPEILSSTVPHNGLYSLCVVED